MERKPPTSIVYPPSPPKSPDRKAQYGAAHKNLVLFEAFEWHSPGDHKHWQRIQKALPTLSTIEVTDLWLPPGSKAKDAESNGYDTYDAWDLGEFDQKGTVPTKWGTKKDLADLATGCKRHGVGLIWDTILNHRASADATETVGVVELDPKDRRIALTEPFDIVAWSRFDFAAPKGKYSTFKFNKSHFNGTDWNQSTERRSIYRYVEEGKKWAQDVGTLQGNADYLMLENIDYTNPEVVEDTTRWDEWIVDELGLSDTWTQHLKKRSPNGLMCMGEPWHGDVNILEEWLDNMSPDFVLYDVPLMYKIARLGLHKDKDLRAVFRDTLVERRPSTAVTFLRIHDTVKGQAMDTLIDYSFTSHAHALLLPHQHGLPCIFFGDLYGIGGPYPEPPTCYGKLPGLVLARKLFAHGSQTDYLERYDCIGWTRSGTVEHPDGFAVILSWTESEERYRPSLRMNVGNHHGGEAWADVLDFETEAVVIDAEGWGKFPCQMNGMACFVDDVALGRERFPVRFCSDFQVLVI